MRNDSALQTIYYVTVIINLIRITLLIQLTLPAIPIVDLTLHLLPYKTYVGDTPKEHFQYKINKINSLPIMMFCNRQL